MSDPEATPEDGWNRYFVKSSNVRKRDLSVYRDDAFEIELFSITGDKHGAEVVDAGGRVVLKADVKKAYFAKVEYTDADGASAGSLKTNSVFSKKHMEFTLPDGSVWDVVKEGGMKQRYTLFDADVPLAKMDLKTLALKRHYSVDIAESVDLPLAMGLLWAVNFAHLQRVAAAGAGAVAAG